MDKTPESWASRRSLLASPPLDYAPWLLKDQWSVSEAAKLLCGRNPHAKIPGTQLHNRHVRVIDLIDQAFAAAQNGTIRVVRNALLPIHLLVDPPSFTRWAQSQGFDVPPDLEPLLDAERPPAVSVTAVQERVATIAQTLKIVDPSLTPEAVAAHPAMRALVPQHEATLQTVLEWVRAGL